MIIHRLSGQAFFHGWGKAAIIGAVGGVISGGIGDNAGTILNAYDREGFQMAAHGLLGGGMTAASGGNFWQGFAAGAASSFAASEFGSMFTGNGFGQIAGMYITGTISGGVSETVAGGSFWDGARDGAISAGLNHAMHLIADPKPKPPDPLLARMAKTLVNGGYNGDNQAGPPGWWQSFSDYWANVGTATKMTAGWLLGVGDDNSLFMNGRVADAMRNSPGIIQARNDFYNNNKTSGFYSFGLKGLWQAGLNPIEQFVGSYNYSISVNQAGGFLQYTLTNTTSFSSFDYHMTPARWNWNRGPMGNFNQTFIFTEPLRH